MQQRKTAFAHSVQIDTGTALLEGELNIPMDAKGIVLFAHGSGSSRRSSRNQFVAKYLQDESLGTLLFDLLTPHEEEQDLASRELRFNIPFLAERLIGATQWISNHEETHNMTVGYFGASTGASAALIAAAELGSQIKAVVSRGGRPDLAGPMLPKVQAATLLIVGGADYGVIELNEHSMDLLGCAEKKLEIIPNATHLFEEHGALEEVGRMASRWFNEYL